MSTFPTSRPGVDEDCTDIFPGHLVPAHLVEMIDAVKFKKKDWHGLARRAILFIAFLMYDKRVKANKVRFMKRFKHGWTQEAKLYAHFKKTCDEASRQGIYDRKNLPDWDKVEKRLDRSPLDEKSNADVRLIFLLAQNLFLTKHLFTFGQREVKRGTVHLLQTSASPMLYFELDEEAEFNRVPKKMDKIFYPPDEACFQRYTLQPHTMYKIPANRIYVLLTIKKTLFSLYVVHEAEASLFINVVDPTRDRKLLPITVCPTPVRRPEEEMVVILEDDWLRPAPSRSEAVSSTSSSFMPPPPPSNWNVSCMPPPPPAERPAKRPRWIAETPPCLVDAATNTDPMEEALHYLFQQTCAEWPAPAPSPWPSSAAAATPGSSSAAAVTPAATPRSSSVATPAHLSSAVESPPPPTPTDEEAPLDLSVGGSPPPPPTPTDEEAPLDLSVGGSSPPPPDVSNPSVPRENEAEEPMDFSLLMEDISSDSNPDEPGHHSLEDNDSATLRSIGNYLDSFTSELSSHASTSAPTQENHLYSPD